MRRFKPIGWAMATGLLAAFASAAELSAEQTARSAEVVLNIPSQPVEGALNTFAQQAGVQILFYSTVVEGLSAPTLVGSFTPQAALTRLLANTPLRYEFINDRMVAIRTKSQASSSEIYPNGADSGSQELRLVQDSAEGSGSAGAGASVAQSQNNQAEPKSQPIQEVVVTARKREERLQDVPLSIAVVTAEDIDRRGLVSSEDYLRGIPGVNQWEAGALGQTIIIRGIETNTNYQNYVSGGSTVATYFGETPTTGTEGLSGSTSIDLKLVDIERVEVLRGPQGTAFGSSSMGGAVRTIPVAPQLDRFEGKVGAGYSATSGSGGDNYNFQGVVNLPLVKDKLALRAVGYRYEEAGYYRNRAGSDEEFLAAVVTPYGAEAFATDEEEVGATRFMGGRVAARYQATDALRFTFTYLKQKRETDGFSGATSGLYEQAVLRIAPQHSRRGQSGLWFDTTVDIANAVVDYDLGWANLLATYSYSSGDTAYGFPYTALLLPWPVSEYGPSNHHERVGEIRLASTLEGPLNFLAGLYTEEIEDRVTWDPRWHGDPATNFLNPGSDFVGEIADRRRLTQNAAFGEVSWTPLPRLTLTGGFRTYEYDRKGLDDREGPFYGSVHEQLAMEASGTNFRANLSYKPSDDTLLYAGWSEGFRLGQPRIGAPAEACDLNGDGIIDGTSLSLEATSHLGSDEMDNYELGGKFALLDRRVAIDAAIFRMDWTDIPVGLDVTGVSEFCRFAGSSTGGFRTNAGVARSEGVELQANLQVADAFRIDVGGSWIDARLMEDAPGLGGVAGDRLPGSPEINANLGLQYEFGIAGKGAFVRADAIYVGPFYMGLGTAPAARAGDYVRLDASVRFQIRDLNLDIFARNLTDEDAFTTRFVSGGPSYGSYLRPRTIGLQLSYDF